MRILHLIYTQGLGGAEKYLKHLLPGLKAYGIDCELIVVCSKNTANIFSVYSAEMNGLGVNTTIIAAGRSSLFSTARKIKNYLKEKDIHILHTHLFHADLTAAIIKSFLFKKLFVISTKHGYQEKVLQQYDPVNYKQPGDLYYYLTKYILKKIDQNVAVSKGMADLYYNLKLTKERYPVIHHGIEVPEFDKEKFIDQCRKSDPQIIIVGRVEVIKGYQFLLDAMPAIVKVFPSIKLLVLGEGSEKENYIKKAADAGLQNNIDFMGFIADPYPYIAVSDVVVSTSFFESFGLVFIESFALKTAVVAFDTPAGNEIMKNNETALLVRKGNVEELAEKIIYLLQNPSERISIAEKAYEDYTKNYTKTVMVNKTADWYKSLFISS